MVLQVKVYEKIIVICCPRYMQDSRYVAALGVLLGVDLSQLSAGLCCSINYNHSYLCCYNGL